MSAPQPPASEPPQVWDEPQPGRDYIRMYDRGDRNMVEQLVGQGYMDGLAKANKEGEFAVGRYAAGGQSRR